ncbi:MAG: transporter substrate-binding domain-containing protein [Anaerolineales bacterium]|nr:transporter substrate-binding domain-containing protein [Anaerolineales bacterium]
MKPKHIVFLILLLGLGLLVACSDSNEEPTQEPTAPLEAATEAPDNGGDNGNETGTTDEAWNRIQSAGKLVAGTSADYPPFAYYTSDFELDGYDIALINAIGAELGLQVEIKDMAFDGLDEALALGQIDVAIAAISVTPEREGLVDFTHVYYIGEDAFLGAEGAGFTVNAAQDLAGQKVGVQNKSVYQDWVENNLVATGLIPEKNLQEYAQISQAIADLQLGRIDTVMLDLKPAQAAVLSGGVEIVGQGLNRQRFSIALPQGEAGLQAELNNALTNLQNTGFLADLAQEFLNLDEVAPIEPKLPVEPVPPIASTCIDGMAFIADLNMNDQNMTNPAKMLPGQTFRKGWRVQNIGTCTWDSTYALAYVAGNVSAARMGGTSVSVVGEVRQGETYDFWVDLVAPTIPGIYQGFWSMRNGEGEYFGSRIWVGVEVVSPNPTPPPAPTATPAPTGFFTVDRTNIKQGECVTFSWSVENIQAVWFYPDGQDFNRYPTTGQGSKQECPSQTTTYDLRVLRTDGTTEIRQITIFVEPSTAAPRITDFSVSPTQIQLGQCVTVTWRVEGNVSNVRLARNGATLWAGAPLSGQMQDCPPEAGFAAYTVEATGSAGSDRLQTNVSVIQ